MHLNLGVAYEQADKLEEAQAAFERASALLPDRDDLRLQMAWIAERQQHGGEAEDLYAKLVDRNPSAETAWFRLGYLRLERDDAQGGAAAFKACLEKRADWPEAQVNLSIAYSKLGQYDDAHRVLSDLLAQHPNHADALQGLAEIALQLQKPQEALGHYTRLLEHGEPSCDILYNCGVLSQQLGESNQAISFYEAALKKEPNFAEALLNLGHALEAAGATDRARDCWIRALDLKPELACGYFAPRVDSVAQTEVPAQA